MEAYTPKPNVQRLEDVYDLNASVWMVMGRQVGFLRRLIISVSITSFSQPIVCQTILIQFTMGATRGCRLSLRLLDAIIHGAEQMSYDDHKILASGSSIEEQKIYWMWCLEEKQKNIGRTNNYAGDEDVEWWGNFLNAQHTILVNYFVGYWPLQIQFKWNIGGPSIETMTNVESLDIPELNNLVHP